MSESFASSLTADYATDARVTSTRRHSGHLRGPFKHLLVRLFTPCLHFLLRLAIANYLFLHRRLFVGFFSFPNLHPFLLRAISFTIYCYCHALVNNCFEFPAMTISGKNSKDVIACALLPFSWYCTTSFSLAKTSCSRCI